ncbi:GNAT family N-acetyltransferase [Saccharothrix algeriensis]|uniref:GNAT family N-acetyltransferase n=1 Tax=Saccharothrix algeriensis TaxID=173560 RepID=A0A8T8HUZ9_9PSEU|nr:GNAT family N-acetyltransferase [Saccharothrix algeriensis]MBM7813763.1 GNAT superfamily N-acetyltransferase [Saccharothrix algeriensis]QTR02221.1 GNAT family N-acetyltransferase [Saccharothrix algeriensis]
MQWTVRAGRPDDAPELARINVDAWQHAYRGIVDDPVLDRMLPESRRPAWARVLALPDPSRVFVAVDGGGEVGAYCAVDAVREAGDAHPDLNTGELVAIYADPRHRGTGAGHAVHEAGVRHLVEQGFRYAVLWVFQDNTSSRDFYESHGWRHDGLVHRYELGGQELPEVRYGRFLPAPRRRLAAGRG